MRKKKLAIKLFTQVIIHLVNKKLIHQFLNVVYYNPEYWEQMLQLSNNLLNILALHLEDHHAIRELEFHYQFKIQKNARDYLQLSYFLIHGSL